MGVRDANLLQCTPKPLQAERRAYIFVMILDTRITFEQLAPVEMEMFTRSVNPVERSFNALRYLDNCLRDIFSQLPEGTTGVMYGDHTASLHSDYFYSDVVNWK